MTERILVVVSALALIVAAVWRIHAEAYAAGVADTERANVQAIAEANAKAIEEWKTAAAEQRARDEQQRERDAAADRETATALRDIDERFQRLIRAAQSGKVQAGRFEVTPEWIDAFNEAR